MKRKISDDYHTISEVVTSSSVFQFLRLNYHIPVILSAAVFMLSVRLQTINRFVRDGMSVFSGNDPWYHYRQVTYTVNNWPSTMPFDPWTGYPAGSQVGQFGTLFDQILATVALIVGLGSPSEETIRLVLILAPPVIGTITIIPVYYLTERLHSRLAGVFAVVVTALLPGVFLTRSLVGVADHNIAEPLFLLVSLIAIFWAFDRAKENVVVFESLAELDRDFLIKSLGPSVAAGVAVALYFWVWPPAVLLIGILGVFTVIYASMKVSFDSTPEPVLLSVAVITLTLSLLLVLTVDTFSVRVNILSPLQILFSFGVALVALSLAYGARFQERKSYYRFAYPVAISTILGVSALVLRSVSPTTFKLIYTNVMRVVGFGQHANTLTIGEAQPFLSNTTLFQAVTTQYGMTFFAAIVGLLLLAGYSIIFLRDEEPMANHLLFVVISVTMILAAFTQVRFNYYLAPFVAMLSGIGVIQVLDYINIPDSAPKLDTYQWLAVVASIGVVIMPMLVLPLSSGAIERGQAHSPGEYQAWEEPLQWMEENTAEYDDLEYYGTYKPTDDFEYGSDMYGVMSWWDYGHWTTVTAQRAPVANPFQQNAKTAARFLLSENETEADAVISELGNGTDVRYVLVDWKMVTPNSKFGAPVVFHPELNQGDMLEYQYTQSTEGLTYGYSSPKQRYYDSLMVRLYNNHGSAVNPSTLVVDYEQESLSNDGGERFSIKTVPSNELGVPSDGILRFNNSNEAQTYLENDTTAHLGGVGIQPRDFVPALTQYRLVKTSEASSIGSRGFRNYAQRHANYGDVRYSDFLQNPGWVKIFERVPGAKVEGDGAPSNSTVIAEVQMNDPTQNQTFKYRQLVTANQNGEFEMTVPYSTSGYDDVTRDSGYANSSVRAVSDYTFVAYQQQLVSGTDTSPRLSYQAWTDKAQVTESQVIGINNSTVTVTMEKAETGLQR